MRTGNYQLCDSARFGVDTVFVTYGWLAADCAGLQLRSSHATDMIAYDFYGARLNPAGDTIHFVDRWTARSDFAADGYHLSHQLLNADWERQAQLDLPLVHESRLRQFTIGLDDLPAGAYRLAAILYDKRTIERFDWSDNPSQPLYMLVLAEIEIPA